MEIKKIDKLTLTLEGTEVEDFRRAISKIAEGNTKIGFSKEILTDKEVETIKHLKTKLHEW